MPDNYVEQPPSDFKAVAKNSEILTRILNSDQTETGLKDLIEKLKNLIYPKIESFVHDAKIVLSEQFNFDLTGKDFSLPQVEAAFKREEKNIDPQIRVWIDDMIKDIHYLNEMHKLEDPNYLANLEKEGGGSTKFPCTSCPSVDWLLVYFVDCPMSAKLCASFGNHPSLMMLPIALISILLLFRLILTLFSLTCNLFPIISTLKTPMASLPCITVLLLTLLTI